MSSASMAEPVLIVYAPAVVPLAQLARFAVEVARVGAGALRLPPADAGWLVDASTAVSSASDLVVLLPGEAPEELILGSTPIAELHSAVGFTGAVGGASVAALLAALAAGLHVRAGSADTPGDGSLKHEVKLVARAAALARLAGRVPMTPDQARAHLATAG
jgi:hypothetical protein